MPPDQSSCSKIMSEHGASRSLNTESTIEGKQQGTEFRGWVRGSTKPRGEILVRARGKMEILVQDAEGRGVDQRKDLARGVAARRAKGGPLSIPNHLLRPKAESNQYLGRIPNKCKHHVTGYLQIIENTAIPEMPYRPGARHKSSSPQRQNL